MAGWTSALSGFMGGAMGAATNFTPQQNTTTINTNQMAVPAFQNPPVAFGIPAGIEHILTPHIHIHPPHTPAPMGIPNFAANVPR